jgi:hypothetical protein
MDIRIYKFLPLKTYVGDLLISQRNEKKDMLSDYDKQCLALS